MAQPHISLAAEKIGNLFGLPVTNSILMTWLAMMILILFSLAAARKVKIVPSALQSVAEVIIEGLYNLFQSVVGEHYIRTFFPLLATIFLFIVVANWGGLLPGVGTIGIRQDERIEAEGAQKGDVAIEKKEENTQNVEKVDNVNMVNIEKQNDQKKEVQGKFIPLFRGATADLNTTLAIAIIAVVAIQYYGVRSLGLSYFKKFFNFSNPIMFGVGLLDIVSEISRIISFAFRLFGNIFAGEVLLTVIAFLMPLFAPLPFIGLELFVGFIQALVFSMLTAVFLNMATVAHENH